MSCSFNIERSRRSIMSMLAVAGCSSAVLGSPWYNGTSKGPVYKSHFPVQGGITTQDPQSSKYFHFPLPCIPEKQCSAPAAPPAPSAPASQPPNLPSASSPPHREPTPPLHHHHHLLPLPPLQQRHQLPPPNPSARPFPHPPRALRTFNPRSLRLQRSRGKRLRRRGARCRRVRF